MAVGEAPQDGRQHVAARRRGRAECERAALGLAQGTELLLHPFKRVEHAQRVSGDDLAGLGQTAGAAMALDELVAHRRFEGLQVLGRRGLAHAAQVGGGGDGTLALDLDEQPKTAGVKRINYAVRERHLCDSSSTSIRRTGYTVACDGTT